MSFKKSSLCGLQRHLNPSVYRACQHEQLGRRNGLVSVSSGIESHRRSICNELPTALLGLENWSYVTALLRFEICALNQKACPASRALQNGIVRNSVLYITLYPPLHLKAFLVIRNWALWLCSVQSVHQKCQCFGSRESLTVHSLPFECQ